MPNWLGPGDSPGIRFGIFFVSLLALTVGGAHAQGRPAVSVDLVYEGNRLSVKPSAPVLFRDVQGMLAAVSAKPLTGQYAVVLFRESPRAVVGYVLAVEKEGTLSLGSQLHEWDPGDRRYRFLGGELYRSYQPVNGNAPWTWLVTIPVSRETQVALLIRAAGARWPVESVAISVQAQPVH